MHVQGFVDRFDRDHRLMPDRPFLFILGAGASKASGIRTAAEFVKDWLETLYHEDPEHPELSFEDWVRQNRAGIEGFDPDDWAVAYPRVYERCFRHDPDRGYAYLEDAMKDARPSYGYTVLAQILGTTEHKVVITTNFDNLAADAVALCTQTFPLVCGHDSLAGFARARPRRPVILKVHHDLLLAPKNEPDELDGLGPGYQHAVAALLRVYTPVVIGYGGNDGSLMGMLESLPEGSIPGGVYWCYRIQGEQPRQQIRRFVGRQKGHLVRIGGFDELMVMIGEKLGISPPDAFIKATAEEYARRLIEDLVAIKKRLESEAASPAAGAGSSKEERGAVQAALASVTATFQQATGPMRWWQWRHLAEAEPDLDKRAAIYREAVEVLPNDVAMLNEAAVFFSRRGSDEAAGLFEHSLRLSPGDADVLGNYAVFLKNVPKDYDRAQELYERALKATPDHASNLGNYASFHYTVRKDYDRAQELYERALKAAPEHADILGNYAVFIKNVRKDYGRAQELFERALKAAPEDADNLGNYAAFLLARGERDRGLATLDRAVGKLSDGEPSGLNVEVWFYAFLHAPPERHAEALGKLKALVARGVRSPGWDFSENVSRAVQDGHPEAPWLEKLPKVLDGDAEPATLADWPAWQPGVLPP